MKRLLTSPLAYLVYLLIAFTIGAFVGARLRHKEFMSQDIRPGREYIAFEVQRMAEEEPILSRRLDEVLKVFEAFQYQVDRVTVLQDGKLVTISLEGN